MTIALCISCGEIKSGAMCECPNCQVKTSGNIDLDIAFSDHHLAKETLEEFGEVIHLIHASISDASIRRWAFLQFVSEKHPSILKVELKPDMKMKVIEAMGDVTLPAVTLVVSPIKRI